MLRIPNFSKESYANIQFKSMKEIIHFDGLANLHLFLKMSTEIFPETKKD